MTVNVPFAALCGAPVTGASRKPTPCCAKRIETSRAVSGEVVLLSTTNDPEREKAMKVEPF